MDKVLEHLMTNGITVAGGDRLGKTIIFAKNQAHADFIAERFGTNYPHLKGSFARVITFQTEYAQSLIDAFAVKSNPPHIAISVDMLDTGFDVPEVVNLVFFKPVRSKTKFWQMVGRGTRLCPDLFGPGKHKSHFAIFDYCGNLKFFGANPDAADGSVAESLGKKLIKTRLELVASLDKRQDGEATSGEAGLREETAERLRSEVAAMNVENFVVRPKRKLVEAYAKPEAWAELTDDARRELGAEVAGLPSELPSEPEEAKRFDLLMLRLQLAVLHAEPSFERLRDQVKEIAGLLEEKDAIPMVHAQMALILEVQTDEWWQDATVPMLETVRKRLRELVQFIEKASRKPIFTDFEDEIGAGTPVELPGFAGAGDFEQFKLKARPFLRQSADNPALRKVRTNLPLTTADLAELERLLASSGAGGDDEIARAKGDERELGLFIRSLVGLDREAAKHALGPFTSNLTGDQIEFVNLVVDYLTEHGAMDAGLLYETPFTDLAPRGPNGLFSAQQVADLVFALERIKANALAA